MKTKDALTGMLGALVQRSKLTERLVKALNHMDMPRAVSIVSSFIPLDELEEMVKFQEDRS